MIALLLILLSSFTMASEPIHWSYILKIGDRHEFYENRQLIEKPKDAWQLLFSLNYIDGNLQKLKDCIFYRVPGSESGILKVTTLPVSSPCEEKLLSPGNLEIKDVKALQFNILDTEAEIDFSLADFTTRKWQARIQTPLSKPEAFSHLSSAAFKSPKIILIAPKSPMQVKKTTTYLAMDSLCHDVSDDCQEVTPSQCSSCSGGWYEIPNGCPIGPKYCGTLDCGKKGRP
ncbi:MAG: hypothetical protein ACLGHN_16040, partial [Bacteriovoracia bacterium]